MRNTFSGGFFSLLAQMKPPAPKWTAENMPDLSGKIMIVTDVWIFQICCHWTLIIPVDD